MTTAIQFLRSNVPGLRPNPLTLSDGMPMVNYNPNDPGLYFKSNDNTLLKIGPTHYSANPPNFNGPGFDQLCKGEMWLDTSAPDVNTPRPILKVWSGAAWVAAGGDILQEEVPQAPRTVLAGPLTGTINALPTFRALDNADLPDDLDYHKLDGGDVEGGLLIGGGNPGWEVSTLTMGAGLTQTVGPNSIQLEVTAGDIAGAGQPGLDFASGDGYVQLNYDGKFTGDSRLKFLNLGSGGSEVFTAHVSTELGFDPATHTHVIKGDVTLSGDLNLTDVYNFNVGGNGIVNHDLTVGTDSADAFAVFAASTFNADVEIAGLNNMTVGGNLTVTNNTEIGTGDANTHNITGATALKGSATIGRTCADAVLVKGGATFECLAVFETGFDVSGAVDFRDDVTIGTDCSDTLRVQGTQKSSCDILIGDNVDAPNGEMITLDSTAGDITTKGGAYVTSEIVVSDPLANSNLTITGSSGDIDTGGTVTAAFFVGDGSQLTNLGVPNALLFEGDIDATTAAAPATPLEGDFYLNTVTGNVTATWPDIGGQAIQENQFIYYASSGWFLGAVQDTSGFVTLNTTQTLGGSKTYNAHQQFENTVTVEGATTLNDTLTVAQATQLNETLTVANNKATTLGGTLDVSGATTLSNTLAVIGAASLSSTLNVIGATTLVSTLEVIGGTLLQSTLTVADSQNTTLGGDLLVKGDTVLGTDCSNTLTIKSAAEFECGFTIGDSGNPCATDFIVYANSGFHCPVTVYNTLTVDGNYATTLGGTLTTVGAVSIGDNLSVTNATTLSSTLDVTGATTLSSTLEVTGAVTLSSSLAVTAGATFSSTVDVTGATTLGNTLAVTGATSLNSTLAVVDATTLGSTLAVTGATTLSSTLAVSDATTLSSTLAVTGAATLNSTLSVADATTLSSTLGVTGAATLSSTLAVNGATTLFAAKDCSNTALTVNGKAVFECETTFNGSLAIPTGSISIGANLTVGGNTVIGDNCSDTLTITATTTIGCPTTVNNTFTVGAFATSLGGTLGVTGNTTLGGTLSVTGNTSLTGSLSVTAATTLNSTLAVKNTTTARTINPEADNTYNLGASGTKWKDAYAVTFHGSLAGNATTATTLQTARTINGTSFNGSANITTATWGTARTVTVGNTGKSVNGSADYSWSLAEIGVNNAAINFNAGTGLSSTGGNATTNQSAASTKTFNIDRSVVDTWYAPASAVSANNGQINFNAGTGLSQSGSNATANQSGNTTKTFSIDRGTVDTWYAPASTVSANNGQINFNAGTGLTSTGGNATANQSGNTTKTFNIDKAYFDGLYQPLGGGGAAGQWEISGSTLRPITGSLNVVPRSDGNANLGTSSLRWANVYTQDMHFSNEGTEGNSIDGTTGNWTLQEGHDYLYFINNKTGVKFRVVMEQV